VCVVIATRFLKAFLSSGDLTVVHSASRLSFSM
jgi:hypothetical protein